MLRDIAQDHKLGLTALAFLVCLLAANTSLRLLGLRDRGEHRHGIVLTGAAILVFSTGIWTTHFTGMLAISPDLPATLDVPCYLLSLGLSIVATAAAFTTRSRARNIKGSVIASGLVLAIGIAAMHFISIHAMQTSGKINFNVVSVAVSWLAGAICAITAMGLLARGSAGWASVCLALAASGTHFAGIGAITLKSGQMDAVSLVVLKSQLIMVTGGACFVILTIVLIAANLDQRVTLSLATEARRLRALADATVEALIFVRNGLIVEANRAVCELAATERASLIGRPLLDLVPGIAVPHAQPGQPVEQSVHLPNGLIMPVEMLWRSAPDNDEQVVAIRNISRDKAAEGQVPPIARIDPLTGLGNKQLFDQRLHQAIALSDRTTIGVALLYVDLDRFASVNDTLGQHAAEQILIQVARRLSSLVRETDSVARIGRDEFVIIQTLTEQPLDAAALPDRIVTEMALPFSIDDQPVVVTASVGVALYPIDGTQAPELVKNARLAVRQAKNDGRGRWRYFESNMNLMLQTKRSLEHDLRNALKEGQFSLNYQPFVDTATLDVVGYEALLRWDHPERGRISPADFVPLAEASGLIVPIGDWVLATACAEAVSWDLPLVISVNLSPAQFIQPGIFRTVAQVLRQTGLPPARLELEITETTLMDDTQNALRVLTLLKGLGVKIAMDDFGTGYSSLSYLRKFPFDKIKIDRSFISDAEGEADAATIVQAIVAMSRSLRLDVTAEGVETMQQLSMLRGLGCDLVQGYLLGRPCSAAQLELHTGQPQWHVINHAGSRPMAASAARTA